MQTFSELQQVAQQYRETNDCTVKAVATLFGCTYGVAHRTLAKHGRQPRRGASWETINKAVTQLSARFNVTVRTVGMPNASLRYAKWRGVKTMTIKQFIKRNPKGVFLLSVRGHVATVRDGVLYDWTADTAQRRMVTGYLQLEG